MRIKRDNSVAKRRKPTDIIAGMLRNLTKQEQFVLCLVLLIILTGWAVKVYRTAHPPQAAGARQVW
jgi:hypothetical protein